jgi:hypothetical protein
MSLRVYEKNGIIDSQFFISNFLIFCSISFKDFNDKIANLLNRHLFVIFMESILFRNLSALLKYFENESIERLIFFL